MMMLCLREDEALLGTCLVTDVLPTETLAMSRHLRELSVLKPKQEASHITHNHNT